MVEMGELGNAHTQRVSNRLAGTLGEVRGDLWLAEVQLLTLTVGPFS